MRTSISLLSGGVALLLHMAEFMQPRVIVFPKTPRIEVDHVLELVELVLDVDDLGERYVWSSEPVCWL